MSQNSPLVLDMIPNIDGKTSNIILYITTSDNSNYDLVHSHLFYEFTFMVRGEIINNCNGESVTVSKNDMMILRPECIHQVLKIPNKNYMYFNLEVSKSFLQDILKQLNVNDINSLFKKPIAYIHCQESDAYELVKLVNLSQQVTNTNDEKQFYLKLIVMRLLIKYVTYNDVSQNQTNNSTLVNKVLTILNNPDKFTMNLGQICDQLGYSQEYIIRLFKNAKLNSPSKIFLKNKMIYASTLLVSSNIKTSNIAELCGIYTNYYFYKSFKSEFGVSPTEYRKKNKIFFL